jgi:hypothetical protein
MSAEFRNVKKYTYSTTILTYLLPCVNLFKNHKTLTAKGIEDK